MMTKEQQKAASDRILAKFPMTESEKRVQRILETSPDEYPKDSRICPYCPVVFQRHEFEEHAQHLASHGASPAQWAEANKRIEKAKEGAKEAAKAER